MRPPVSSPVTLVLDVVDSTPGQPAIVKTAAPHFCLTGDTVRISGHSDAALNADHVVTVLSLLTFSVPVLATGGTGGYATVVRPAEPLTLDEGKLRAGLDWLDGDPRDALMRNFIAGARRQVEFDTHLAVRLQVRDVFVDDLSYGLGWPDGPHWPGQSLPLAAVLEVSYVDQDGDTHVVDASVYEVDRASGRLALAPGQSWPTASLRTLSPWVVRIASGWPTLAAIPADLIDAIGLLTAHRATTGRDLATSGASVNTVPMGYDSLIEGYRMEVLA
jgi:uncharacterized phiE125 gp8 family phage protein